MSIQGNLATMGLQELLLWAVEQSATGMLELERNKVCKRIAFNKGRIIGCTSDDPPSRIGQFLLARGKINREVLAQALDVQKETGATLGAILLETGVIEPDELTCELREKAEETIFSVFDWDEAVFRFKPGEPHDPWMIEVQLEVDEVLERGKWRREQMEVIRRLFVSSGVVLERRDVSVPAEIMANGLARGILGTIDGDRTLGEVLYHTHAAEFLVLKFLASVVQSGLIEVARERPVDPQHLTLLDNAIPVLKPAPVEKAAPDAAMVPAPPSTFEERLELAQHFLAQDETEAALDTLDECYDERPGDEFLGHMIEKAEAAFIQRRREEDLTAHQIPSKVEGASPHSGERPLSPAERFLLGIMEEEHTIQTLLWIAPMREVDVYRALSRLKHGGLIELHDGGEVLDGTRAPAIVWA